MTETGRSNHAAKAEIAAAEVALSDFPGWNGWLAPNTVATYTREIGRYLTTADVLGFPWWQITGKRVVKHIDRMWTLEGKHKRPLSPRTVMIAVAALNRVVTFKRDVKPDLPIVVTQQVKDRLIKYEVDYTRAGHSDIQADEIPLGDLLAMEQQIDRNTLRGMRDAAAFTLAIGMGCRSSELVGINLAEQSNVSDLRPINIAGDLPVWVPKAKNDRRGKGRMCYVERIDAMPELCPLIAMEDYLEVLRSRDYVDGPLFLAMATGSGGANTWPSTIRRWGRDSFSKFVSVLAAKAGLPPGYYSAHSLRRTAIRVMRRGGAELDVIADHVGHKSMETTRRYTGTVAYEQATPMKQGIGHAMNREKLS